MRKKGSKTALDMFFLTFFLLFSYFFSEAVKNLLFRFFCIFSDFFIKSNFLIFFSDKLSFPFLLYANKPEVKCIYFLLYFL
ncbi:hypothetical protein MSMAL_0391 [Methanosarcina mazei LYC]|uniref:Uncharacterized protein n=1 Tax=Methanosarcina mazei LYC TaxID=1434114 RepID=A0A0E3WNN1_METMZ|nr:hypothetical protein MSMAL_0391 [Methanosarcina mazei LYC]